MMRAARRDFPALLGQLHTCGGTVKVRLQLQRALQFLDLHGKRRLRDGAGSRRPPEVLVLGDRREVAQLPQRDG